MTVCTPQQGRPEEEKEQFYEKLQHEIDSRHIRTDEEVIFMDDLNVWRCKERNTNKFFYTMVSAAEMTMESKC